MAEPVHLRIDAGALPNMEKKRGQLRLLSQSQEVMPASGRGRVPFDEERMDWRELIGKKSGEIKGQEFYLDRE